MRITREPTREELHCLICKRAGVTMQHVEKRSQAPDRVHDPTNIVPLCPRCHDRIDNQKVWENWVALDKNGRYVYQVAYGDVGIATVPCQISPRHGCLVPLETSPQPVVRVDFPSLEALDEYELIEIFEQADKIAGAWFLRACQVADEFRRRYSVDGQDWRIVGSERLGRSKTTVYLYSEIWQMLQPHINIYPQSEALLLPRGTLAIAAQVQQDKRQDALSEAVHMLAEFGQAKPAAVRRRFRELGYLPPPRSQYYTIAQLRQRLAEWPCKHATMRNSVAAFLHWLEGEG